MSLIPPTPSDKQCFSPCAPEVCDCGRAQQPDMELLSGGFHFTKGQGGIAAVIAMFEAAPQTFNVIGAIAYLNWPELDGYIRPRMKDKT